MPMPTDKYPGIEKLKEECAELITVLAKLSAYPDGNHPAYSKDFTIFDHLQGEMGDVYAALDFFIEESNVVDDAVVTQRRAYKTERFRKWHHEPPVRAEDHF